MSNESKDLTMPAEETVAEDTQESSTNATQREKRGLPIAWIIISLFVIASVAAGWLGYRYVYQDLLATNQQLQQQAQSQATQLSALNDELTQLKRQQQQLPSQIEQQLQHTEQGLRRAVSQQAQEQSDLQRAVQAVQAELAGLDVSQATAWRVIEARQLVEQASNKVYIDQKPALALQLLTLADTHLAALNNPAYQAARQAINDDKVALNSIAVDQHLQVAMTLSSLRANLMQQDWQMVQPSLVSEAIATPADAPWYQHFKASMGKLFQQLIQVQHRSKPITPQLSAAFIELSKQRVLLQLQLAQQAALSQSDTLFQASLTEALALLSELAGQTELALDGTAEQLTQLRNQQLQPKLPEQLRSLAILNRHAQAVTTGARP
ncbi:uroporphyrinogen-III C-methyltransferase [Pseudidiomarina sediminum]|uniref:uroporphyrinogen-III C-methyltransferase n=1 Tax=Pseudidiomarina sediminum TaxID=431675 RepID=UPI001C95BC3F|nr:uroporphyrinogen-III C-methyltransferase [Pseudidiomarina sediminum]MBY6064620.1 uroporphyrinogen-III C-methyltransferase [Pseudidiomarina sediminum]